MLGMVMHGTLRRTSQIYKKMTFYAIRVIQSVNYTSYYLSLNYEQPFQMQIQSSIVEGKYNEEQR